ncbi:hypothetical protein ACIGGF_15770 [Rhodococcus sp. NPDC078407]|uniref:hypothetical protein n=1 Tax=Rhodococcus sp. NPDC078407 TaxID=3364509 RepID=UPI0037C9B7EC
MYGKTVASAKGGSVDKIFDAVSWNVSRKSYKWPKTVTMGTIEAMIEAYNAELDRQVKRSGQEPDRASRVPQSRASIYRQVGSANTVLIETARYLRAHDRTVPARLDQFVASLPGGEDSVALPPTLNPDTPTELLRRMYHSAVGQARTPDIVKISAFYSVRLLQESRRSSENLAKAFDVAQVGYDAARVSQNSTLRPALEECARSAAWSWVLRSRLAVALGEDEPNREALKAVHLWKAREADAAESLNRPITAAVARFHAERAQGLLLNDIVGELRALRAVSTALIDGHRRQHDVENPENVRYHDLTMIIKRLCANDWAYTGSRDFGDAVSEIFPEGIAALVESLMGIYSVDDRGVQAKNDAQALLRLKQTNDGLLASYLTGEPNIEQLSGEVEKVDVLDFLRAFDIQILQAIALTNYSVALHDLKEAQVELSVPVDPAELLVTAHDYCRFARLATRDRGSGQALLRLLGESLERLEGRVPRDLRVKIRSERRDSFPKLGRKKVDELVLLALTSRRMRQKDLQSVTISADAIHRYLVVNRNGPELNED